MAKALERIKRAARDEEANLFLESMKCFCDSLVNKGAIAYEFDHTGHGQATILARFRDETIEEYRVIFLPSSKKLEIMSIRFL
jgi:hypothetical protein